MKRIIKVLVVSALMVVFMATTGVSPALADHNNGNDEYHFGYGKDKTSTYSGYQYKGNQHVYGWACGSKKQEGYNDKYC
jgi:hypothetical protein